MAEFKNAETEQSRVKELSYTLWTKMTTRIHRPLKIIAFNANGI
jgi:hypothetical protein